MRWTRGGCGRGLEGSGEGGERSVDALVSGGPGGVGGPTSSHVADAELGAVCLLESAAEEAFLWCGEVGTAGDPGFGVAARQGEELKVPRKFGGDERRGTVLAGAEEITGAADLEVPLGDAEAVGGLGDRLHACDRVRSQRSCDHGAEASSRSATHATAELMKLRETKALRLLDDHE